MLKKRMPGSGKLTGQKAEDCIIKILPSADYSNLMIEIKAISLATEGEF